MVTPEGNERLTTLTGAALLVLIVVALGIAVNVRELMSLHVFVGALLSGPLIVKLGSTGYRFLRYYTGSPSFVRKGPPRLALRILAPLLVAATLSLAGSGIGLLVTPPSEAGPLRYVHVLSALVWLPLLAIHVSAHIRQLPPQLRGRVPERERTLGVLAGSLIAGALAAALVRTSSPALVAWSKSNAIGPLPVIAGLLAAALAVAGGRALRRYLPRPHRSQERNPSG